jgi:hypothetical protein
MAFQKAEPQIAYLKTGLLGFQGSGKTYTAKNIAIGLHRYCVEHETMKADTPVYFLDTETGSDWMIKHFNDAGIPLYNDKTRAFTRLIPAIKEVSKEGAILIIDSISHFWKELSESFEKKKNRKYGLTFQDRGQISQMWQKFTDEFVNAPCHIILCGRAGYEWDYFENQDGKKELEKTGVKMKAQSELGYEPSLLVYMEQKQTFDERDRMTGILNTGSVWKDRSNTINGKTFDSPDFDDILPHVQSMNIGGVHVGVITDQSSEDMIEADDYSGRNERREKEVTLDEIQCHLVKLHPSRKAEDTKAKGDLLEKFFGTRSWERVATMQLDDLRRNYLQMTTIGDVEKLGKDSEETF